MSRIELSKGSTTIRRRSRRAALAAVVVLATAGLAVADHYPDVSAATKKKDRAIINGIARMTYADPWEISLVSECNCIEPTCDGGFMIACGGEIDPYYAGILTSARRTSRETCYVCGCADNATLRATPVCLGF